MKNLEQKSLAPEALQALSHIQRLGRRDFLKFSSVAASLALTGGLLSPLSAPATVPQEIKHLSDAEYAVFRRLVEVVLVTDGTRLVPVKDVPVLQTLDAALLATMAPHILAGLKGGIAYFNDGPQARFGKRFVDLDDAQARAFLDAWADSPELPRRALAVGLKKLVGLAYWANPPTWAPLGYDGPVSRRWGLQSLGNAPMPKA